MVWRDLGIDVRISFNSSAKPSSSMRSASSRTRISSVSSVKEAELRIWSMKRPGVAMMMSGRERKAASCSRREKPPTSWAKVISV